MCDLISDGENSKFYFRRIAVSKRQNLFNFEYEFIGSAVVEALLERRNVSLKSSYKNFRGVY